VCAQHGWWFPEQAPPVGSRLAQVGLDTAQRDGIAVIDHRLLHRVVNELDPFGDRALELVLARGDLLGPAAIDHLDVLAAGQALGHAAGVHRDIAAAHNNQFWKVAKVIGREDLVGDPRFKTSPDRIAHKDELETIVQDWLCQRTTKEAFSALLAEGVTCGTLNTIADMVKEPQVHAREMIQEVEHPRIGKIPVPGTAIKFSSIPKVPLKHPPDMGENNEDILCGLLGHSKEELGAWEMEGVFEEKGGGANDAG